jgi:hypothetical protein
MNFQSFSHLKANRSLLALFILVYGFALRPFPLVEFEHEVLTRIRSRGSGSPWGLWGVRWWCGGELLRECRRMERRLWLRWWSVIENGDAAAAPPSFFSSALLSEGRERWW